METLCTCMFVHNLVCTNVWLEVSMCIRLVYFGAHRGGSRWTGLTLHCDQNCVPMQMADARCLAVAATAAEAQRNQPARPTHTQTYCIPSCAFSSWACCPPPLAVLSLRKTSLSSRKFRSTATIRERGNVVDIWDNNTEGEARLGKHVRNSRFTNSRLLHPPITEATFYILHRAAIPVCPATQRNDTRKNTRSNVVSR